MESNHMHMEATTLVDHKLLKIFHRSKPKYVSKPILTYSLIHNPLYFTAVLKTLISYKRTAFIEALN